MEFDKEKCAMQVMKTTPVNQDKIRTLGENETYKYLVILKLTPSNNWRWKKKIKKVSH